MLLVSHIGHYNAHAGLIANRFTFGWSARPPFIGFYFTQSGEVGVQPGNIFGCQAGGPSLRMSLLPTAEKNFQVSLAYPPQPAHLDPSQPSPAQVVHYREPTYLQPLCYFLRGQKSSRQGSPPPYSFTSL